MYDVTRLFRVVEVLRVMKNLTRQQLADEAGLSTSVLTLYVQGKRSPSLKAIEKIAKALGTTTLFLMLLSEMNGSEPESLQTTVGRQLLRYLFEAVDG